MHSIMSFRARESSKTFAAMIRDGILGSIAKIEWAATGTISAMPDLLPDFTYLGFVEFTSGNDWQELYNARFSASLDAQLLLQGGSQTIRTRIPQTSAASLSTSAQLQNSAMVLKITTGNGDVMLIGSPDFPVFANASNGIGANSGDSNGYPIEFNCTNREAAGFYTEGVAGALTYNESYLTYNESVLTYGT